MTIRQNVSTVAAAAAIPALTAGAASAATIEMGSTDLRAGDAVLVNANLAPGTTDSVIFTAIEALRIDEFSLTGNGFSRGADLMLVSFGYTGAASGGLSVSETFDDEDDGDAIIPGASQSIAFDFLDGFSLSPGESFEFFFASGSRDGARNVDIDLAFETVAPVPVPAAGGLLIGALGAAGLFARRRRKSAT